LTKQQAYYNPFDLMNSQGADKTNPSALLGMFPNNDRDVSPNKYLSALASTGCATTFCKASGFTWFCRPTTKSAWLSKSSKSSSLASLDSLNSLCFRRFYAGLGKLKSSGNAFFDTFGAFLYELRIWLSRPVLYELAENSDVIVSCF